MKTLARSVLISFFSIGTACAQAAEPSNSTADKTCLYAGEKYSQGATICVTDIAGLTCDNQAHWTAASNLDPSHCGTALNQGSDDSDNSGDNH